MENLMDKVYINGVMGIYMKVNLKKIKEMEKVDLYGKRVIYMKVILLRIREQDMVYLYGKMVNIKGINI